MKNIVKLHTLVPVVGLLIYERMVVMELAQAVKSYESRYTIDNAMDILLEKLDDSIDDVENNRVQTIDDAWEEIDVI